MSFNLIDQLLNKEKRFYSTNANKDSNQDIIIV